MRERLFYEKFNNTNEKTGKTIAVIKKDNLVGVGISICHDRDQFNKKIGRKIALGRAKHALDVLTGYKNSRDESENELYFSFDILKPNNDLLNKFKVPYWLFTDK